MLQGKVEPDLDPEEQYSDTRQENVPGLQNGMNKVEEGVYQLTNRLEYAPRLTGKEGSCCGAVERLLLELSYIPED